MRWTGLPVVSSALAWRPLQPGLELAEAELAVNRGWLRLRVIAVRLDPARFTRSCATARAPRSSGLARASCRSR